MIKDSFITHSNAASEGGTVYLENEGMMLEIKNTSIKNTTAKSGSGGFAQVNKGRKIVINSTKIVGTYSNDAQIMKI